ncbi:MAG: hypothetical protein AAFY76_02280 [Cyanobacteria bacterium J06649_11]
MDKERIIEQLDKHRVNFDTWLSKNYSQKRIKEGSYDDTGYPNWNDVEETFELAFSYIDFEYLSEAELEVISYLLARQWDVGNIFPYFKEEISLLGMTEQQLLILSEYGLRSKEWSYKQQCAASIWKARNNRERAINIALKYHLDSDADIRRHALSSLDKLEYEKIELLLEESWKSNDEIERDLCLIIWKKVNKKRFLEKLSSIGLNEEIFYNKYRNLKSKM